MRRGCGIAGFLCAIVLVIGYRRFVQKRPLFGPEAYRFPERGLGVQAYRDRLQRSGIDPDRIGSPFGAPPNPEASGLAVAAAAARDADPGRPDGEPGALTSGCSRSCTTPASSRTRSTRRRTTRLLERLR